MLIQIFITLITLSISFPLCKDNTNFCKKCNVVTDNCEICENKEILIPDKKGGCTGPKKCQIGYNYCEECDEDKTLCKECSSGFVPDENGGCSNSLNCEFSYRGECLKCKEDFILVGGSNLKFCKDANSDDFMNCKTIDFNTGLCKECEENYFLNFGDKKCTEIEFCKDSVYGKCISCIDGYYLDYKNKNICKENFKEDKFFFCIESEDGKKCSKCQSGFYFDEDEESEGKCVSTNYCSQSENFRCTKCKEKYFFTKKDFVCVSTENCLIGDQDTGNCKQCVNGFYFDANDGKCKSNKEEDDDLKYCSYFTDECISCESNYYLGEDKKCSFSINCKESSNGVCKKCSEGFYLGKDNRCSDIEHCINSNSLFACQECEDGYYYNNNFTSCLLLKKDDKKDDKFRGCKRTDTYGIYCYECKDDFYLNKTDNLCYSNEDRDSIFYKCAKTNMEGNKCSWCIENYHIGSIDKKCSILENCAIIERGEDDDEDKCIRCGENYCLNVNKDNCEYFNLYVIDEETKQFFNCNKTNDKGTLCEECLIDFDLNKNGFCENHSWCEKEGEDGKCNKCIEGDSTYSFCINKNYGCVENYLNENCLRCDDDLNFDNCTECKEGYELSLSEQFEGEYVCTPVEN